MHLSSNGCVAIRFKMLTYCVYAPLLNRIDALPLNANYLFELASEKSFHIFRILSTQILQNPNFKFTILRGRISLIQSGGRPTGSAGKLFPNEHFRINCYGGSLVTLPVMDAVAYQSSDIGRQVFTKFIGS